MTEDWHRAQAGGRELAFTVLAPGEAPPPGTEVRWLAEDELDELLAAEESGQEIDAAYLAPRNRRVILAALEGAGEPLSTRSLFYAARDLGYTANRDNLRRQLTALAREGLVRDSGTGGKAAWTMASSGPGQDTSVTDA